MRARSTCALLAVMFTDIVDATARAARLGDGRLRDLLASGTVFGTVGGGPFAFQDRGFHELKGVPGRWPLLMLSGVRTEPW